MGMETVPGNGGGLLHPGELSWDSSPAQASLATPGPHEGPHLFWRASCKHLCLLPAGATTFHPVSWGGSFTNTRTKTQILLQLPVAVCAEIFFQRCVRHFRLPHSY